MANGLGTIWPFFLMAVASWMCGAIPCGPAIARACGGVDPRQVGSGNVGAANVVRAAGWAAGALTLAADFFKGFLPLAAFAAVWALPLPWLALSGGLAVAGACYSPFLRGRGGKGVATGLGVLTFLAPAAALVFLAAFAALFFSTRIVAWASLGGLVAVILFLYGMPHPQALRVWAIAWLLLSVWRHGDNFRRWRRGEERPLTRGGRREG